MAYDLTSVNFRIVTDKLGFMAECDQGYKDKVAKAFPTLESAPTDSVSAQSVSKDTGKMSDAQAALLSLGYSRQEVATALSKVDASVSLEDMIRLALKKLMK